MESERVAAFPSAVENLEMAALIRRRESRA